MEACILWHVAGPLDRERDQHAHQDAEGQLMKFRHVSPNVSRTLLTHLKGQPQGSDPSSQRTFPQQPAAIPETFHSQRDALCPSCSAKAHAGIARRAGRSPSEARKLPQQKPRSPRHVSETGKLQRGASGGMQGGPRRGRSPITGPALPSPEAAQTK